MIKVSRRGGFSDRNAIRAENTEIQLKDFDERTRIQLENMINEIYTAVFGARVYYTEDRIQKLIDKITTDSTVIIIAHRKSTIENSDKIIYLKDGMVDMIVNK